MSTRLGLISDVHASPTALADALAIFARERVDDIFCAGDIAGYFDTLSPTIDLLQQAQCKTVLGNHDQAYLETHCDNPRMPDCRYLASLPLSLSLDIGGRRIYCVHAEPPAATHGGIKLLDQQGRVMPERERLWQQQLQGFDSDILIVGHTHQVFAARLADTLVVNPGSTVFNHSCMILDLEAMTTRTFALEKHAIIPCWNFSMLYGSNSRYPTSGG